MQPVLYRTVLGIRVSRTRIAHIHLGTSVDGVVSVLQPYRYAVNV